MALSSEWFCALLDTAPDVYFRYVFEPEARLAYVSPAVEALTGRTPAEFYADPSLCFAVVAGADRRQLRQVLHARRELTFTIHITRDGLSLPVDVRTVAVVRRRRMVAIEGMARLAVGVRSASPGRAAAAESVVEPVQQRLASLLAEVHELLHRVMPPGSSAKGDADAPTPGSVLTVGDLALDVDRLTVTEAEQPVALTTREVMVLKYLLQRPGRVVTRQQLLSDVWDYHYTGDDRTVDVHISRLRRKLPSLRGRLTALRGIGYRLDVESASEAA